MKNIVKRIAVALALSGAAVLSLTACGEEKAPQVAVNVPSDVPALQSEGLGAALKQYGYTPVTLLRPVGATQPVGYVYVACGGEMNITKCGSDLHNRGTATRPNIYTDGSKVVKLEGPSIPGNSFRMINAHQYYADVPADYQDFAALSTERQQQLLSVMTEVVKALGKKPTQEEQVLRLSIGLVTVRVV